MDRIDPYLAVDLGGSQTRLGLFSSLEEPAFTLLDTFATQPTYDDQLQRIFAAVDDRKIARLAGTGVSIGARVARDGRSLTFGPNLPDYLNRPFAADLEGHLNCPVRLGHDTVCGLLGEKRFGVLADIERSAYLTVSTGTGAAIQLGKDKSALTSSIEFGHQILDGNERLCLCGQIGCLETFTGGRQVELRYGKPMSEFADLSFWQVFSSKIALGLVNLAQLTRIDAVAVGGSIALHNDFLLPMMQTNVDAALNSVNLPLLRARLGEYAPLIGAVSLLAVSESTILH